VDPPGAAEARPGAPRTAFEPGCSITRPVTVPACAAACGTAVADAVGLPCPVWGEVGGGGTGAAAAGSAEGVSGAGGSAFVPAGTLARS
jgi:hypothetical protein